MVVRRPAAPPKEEGEREKVKGKGVRVIKEGDGKACSSRRWATCPLPNYVTLGLRREGFSPRRRVNIPKHKLTQHAFSDFS